MNISGFFVETWKFYVFQKLMQTWKPTHKSLVHDPLPVSPSSSYSESTCEETGPILMGLDNYHHSRLLAQQQSLLHHKGLHVLCCNASTFLLVSPSACIIPLQYRIHWLIKILFSYRTLEWICSWASLWTTAIFQVRIIVAPENYPSNTTCEHPSPYRAFSVTWFSTTKSLVCWRTSTKHRTVGGTSIKTVRMY